MPANFRYDFYLKPFFLERNCDFNNFGAHRGVEGRLNARSRNPKLTEVCASTPGVILEFFHQAREDETPTIQDGGGVG